MQEVAREPFEAEVRIRNNRLKRMRVELGVSQRRLAGAVGVSVHAYNALETMRESPLTAKGEWRDVCRRIAEWHGVDCEELWPSEVLAVKKNVVVRAMSGEEVAALADPTVRERMLPSEVEQPDEAMSDSRWRHDLERLMHTALTDRERRLLYLRFFEDKTLPEVGEILGGAHDRALSRERTRQIEMKALRKLEAAGARTVAVESGIKPPRESYVASGSVCWREETVNASGTAVFQRGKACPHQPPSGFCESCQLASLEHLRERQADAGMRVSEPTDEAVVAPPNTACVTCGRGTARKVGGHCVVCRRQPGLCLWCGGQLSVHGHSYCSPHCFVEARKAATPRETRLCKCGCGREFEVTPSIWKRQFATLDCKHAAQRRGARV